MIDSMENDPREYFWLHSAPAREETNQRKVERRKSREKIETHSGDVHWQQQKYSKSAAMKHTVLWSRWCVCVSSL